jgi:hypothetical protein
MCSIIEQCKRREYGKKNDKCREMWTVFTDQSRQFILTQSSARLVRMCGEEEEEEQEDMRVRTHVKHSQIYIYIIQSSDECEKQ